MSAKELTKVYTLRHGEGCEWLLPVDSNDYDALTFEASWRRLHADTHVSSQN
jgi:hypothetical protein